MSDLVPFRFNLMTTHDEVQVVLFQETLCHIRPKLAAHSALADGAAILCMKTREGENIMNILIYNNSSGINVAPLKNLGVSNSMGWMRDRKGGN